MINIKEYPKSKKLLEDFARKNLLAFQKNITKEQPVEGIEIPEITDEMAEQYANALLVTNPRILFDFMDSQEIFICIDMFQGEFFGSIIGSLYKSNKYKERVELEQEMYVEAFKQLEEKL